jgi:hypothetical protein
MVAADLDATMQALPRICFLPPPREAMEATQLLSMAVDAHLRADTAAADHFPRRADNPLIREWTESLWGKNSPHVVVKSRVQMETEIARVAMRMPNAQDKALLHRRDGYHCRFCGLPVIRAEVRKRIALAYPSAVP